ncbi:MAG TPA: TetR/AcrR family transcriptional regulator [Planctomycetaceae bacterium]
MFDTETAGTMGKGRPREFDTAAALDAAMELFWRRGYEGTSLAALTEATGVGAPSLYAAFGNKEALFRKALGRYLERPASYLRKALAAPTARAVAEQAFRGAIDMVMRPGAPEGCLLVHGALASTPTTEAVREELGRLRAAAEAAVRRRFERSVAEGDLPPGADPAALARFLMTVIWGMSVQAAGGARRKDLEQVAEVALRCWPPAGK